MITNIEWEKYRLSDRSIDIQQILIDKFDFNVLPTDIKHRIKLYLHDLYQIQPIISRQAAAMVIMNTRNLPYWI